MYKVCYVRKMIETDCNLSKITSRVEKIFFTDITLFFYKERRNIFLIFFKKIEITGGAEVTISLTMSNNTLGLSLLFETRFEEWAALASCIKVLKDSKKGGESINEFFPQVLNFSTRKERKDLKIRANLVLTGYALSKIERQ